MSMRKIYRKIAKKHGVSISQVRDDMQHAINTAYTNTPDNTTKKEQQNKVECSAEIPTPEELILHLAKDVKKTKNHL